MFALWLPNRHQALEQMSNVLKIERQRNNLFDVIWLVFIYICHQASL